MREGELLASEWCGNVSLPMATQTSTRSARSEEGTRDGRGLSMFICDKRDGGVDVRHIEHKLGIHGSPTCELVYKMQGRALW